jgi:hypothetical protein
VAYHRDTVLHRTDDHPGQALAYYASRGETPLEWGGSGARALGLAGTVTEAQFEAIYGPGSAVDPTTGERLVSTRRPGMELVIAAHKSLAELGVIGRAEDMHRILDAERNATLAYLDDLVRLRGGRRGAASVATPTAGLTYAVTRHATSRAGDPALTPRPHRQPRKDGRRPGRVEGSRHVPAPGPPTRRHHGRPGGRGPRGRPPRLRHRARRRPLGTSGPVGHRRRRPRSLSAASGAQAKVVLVGDHRQLGAVGPGGGFESLVDRLRRRSARAGR